LDTYALYPIRSELRGIAFKNKIPNGLFIIEYVLIIYRSDLMVDFEDVMQKIKDLSGKYNEEIDAEKEKQSALRKQSEDAAYIVKAKIKKLEAALTLDMPFQVEYPIGEITEDTSLPSGDRVFLIKTPKNKINVRVHNMRKREEQEKSYIDTDPDFLTMITDQKLDEFVNMIQEELKKTPSNDVNQNTIETK
jgi:hypothetical protein